MEAYKCKQCKKLQYTANTNDKSPCIYCSGECEKVDDSDKSS